MKKNDEGFTLIELLIVIVILGILAAVVVFAVGGITQDAEENACDAEKRAVETAVEAYRADTGSYPASLTPLLVTGTDDGFLRSTPTFWTVATDGSGDVVSAATLPGDCA